ncbi:MAG: outer membrane protein assembly factor BamE [Dokdonella sp.]|jgi:outer membrane protein assembly factor BamE|uniref:outer membrane protein assembly factor BamE n=1 Tax=Dokdonella sp. TaxID=2291710 RepID=UPI001B565056|nr:outer membrane protein assembly factor BamE [Dokdonella sp.]MCC6441503.1 outer membrane protein assembly factor BamE [Rhodanobacteraceae bacterium]MBK8122366.1 outer membrane protein assembly factor BamE [Dokdonella sp.]MBP6327264.1 outer membrane protein assembly factor BamE [Dokdonella sp.]MBP6329915.1 outer membrane protein assembly factor BamE [Dokdonella sp.]HNV09411.1 outer membrane protein assembly factor BamE [Dokdonella sp.]
MLLRLIALIALISLSGCGALYKLDVQQGNLFDKDQVDMLKPGMSKRQVLVIMGSPSIITPFDQDRWDYVSSIRRGRGKMESKDLVLYFENEALARIEGDYFPEDPQQMIKDARKFKRQYPDEKREDDEKKRREQRQG